MMPTGGALSSVFYPLLVATAIAGAGGLMTWGQVVGHTENEDLHITVAQATANAERLAVIEGQQNMIGQEVGHIRDAVEDNKVIAESANQAVQAIKIQNVEMKGDIKAILLELQRQRNGP